MYVFAYVCAYISKQGCVMCCRRDTLASYVRSTSGYAGDVCVLGHLICMHQHTSALSSLIGTVTLGICGMYVPYCTHVTILLHVHVTVCPHHHMHVTILCPCHHVNVTIRTYAHVTICPCYPMSMSRLPKSPMFSLGLDVAFAACPSG